MMLNSTCPFQPGQKLRLKASPGELVEFVTHGNTAGKHVFIQVRHANGKITKTLATNVEAVETIDQDPRNQLRGLLFGKVDDLKRLLTYEKLEGSLHEIIYSMEAAQIDFKPYQFKPVLKFINSPTQKLILADEVGLGKTIESGLIWLEVQARHRARRLLVVCPATLKQKWESELKEKFFVNAQLADFRQLEKEVADFERYGIGKEFALVCSYGSIRPSSADTNMLRRQKMDDEEVPSSRYPLLNKLHEWDDPDNFPFDLVIFDEAHYMRNTATNAHMLGEILSSAARGVLFVSATPVHNTSDDLHALLKLIDPEFFDTKYKFTQLMEQNRPTVQASLCLAKTPLDTSGLKRCLKDMNSNQYLNGTPMFEQFKRICDNIYVDPENLSHIERAQDFAEKLNLIGSYFNRTMRKQIDEKRPTRKPFIVTVKYNHMEREFYDNIRNTAINKCIAENTTFAKFAHINQLLIAASCLPAYAKKLQNKEQENEELNTLIEVFDSLEEPINPSRLNTRNFVKNTPRPDELAKNDSKLKKLFEILDANHGEKIVIFAYYRGTLEYLYEQITRKGYKVGLIYGIHSQEERWETIYEFRNGDISILLSSEVGSEGIDLQFSHTLINYDMPWNPMRVEQRIGRIDRVGQQANVLNIINFNVDNTIEQRVFEKLHIKLGIYADIFGDIEEILGKEVRELTLDLFSQVLTPEEEEERIMRSERIIAKKIKDLEMLERASHEFVGLSDYIQRKISEGREMRRYISAEELEDYFKNFFGNQFKDTHILQDNPVKGCFTVYLSDKARDSFDEYIFHEKLQGYPLLKGNTLKICFNKEIWDNLRFKTKQNIAYVNHLSPLIRWITSIYKKDEDNMCRTSALITNIRSLEEGSYIYSINLWILKGISSKKLLSYSIYDVTRDEILSASESEHIFKEIIDSATNWIYGHDIAREDIDIYIDKIEEHNDNEFENEVLCYDSENTTQANVRRQAILNKMNSKIDRLSKSIETLVSGQRPDKLKYIRAFEAQIRNVKDEASKQLRKIDEKSQIMPQNNCIAMGIFYNTHRKMDA